MMNEYFLYQLESGLCRESKMFKESKAKEVREKKSAGRTNEKSFNFNNLSSILHQVPPKDFNLSLSQRLSSAPSPFILVRTLPQTLFVQRYRQRPNKRGQKPGEGGKAKGKRTGGKGILITLTLKRFPSSRVWVLGTS